MNKRELIEDSEEVREAIEDLKAKSAANKEASKMSEKEIIRESEEMANDYAEDETSYSEDHTDNYEASEENSSRTERVSESEDTPADSFVKVREESRRIRKEQFSEKRVRENKMRTNPASSKRRPRKRRSADTIISLENVSMEYVKDKPVLKNINIDIKKGEFVFIVGDSGSGKSTLMKLLLRELVSTDGSITVNGYNLERMKHRHIPKFRRRLGVVFQDFKLLKDRNVYENVAFAQRIIRVPSREIKKNVPEILATVGLAKKYKAIPSHLSGGEQQRVALARAIVNRPDILLADEPTGNLDPKTTVDIMNILKKINENGTTVIVVTHNDKIVNDMQKRVITIKRGIVVSDEEEGSYIDEN